MEEPDLVAAILDEAQQIKNPDAAVTRVAHALRARHRLALTGTPLENRPLDLWSLMGFANPGYLGTPPLVRRALRPRGCPAGARGACSPRSCARCCCGA